MFFPNIDVAINKIDASLVQQGRFVTAVWADAPKVPVMSFAIQIIGEQVQMIAPLPGTPNPFSLADTKRLENSMAEIGFRDVQKERVNVTFEFTSGKDYSRFCQTVLPPARAALSKETEERKEDICRKVAEEATKNYGTTDGSIKMDNEFICVVGTKHETR